VKGGRNRLGENWALYQGTTWGRLQYWADCEFSRRVVHPMAIPGLASWDILSRP
jgi:hypothetical protein